MIEGPFEIEKERAVLKTVRPETVKKVDTGKKQIIQVRDEKGSVTQEEKVIYDEIIIPAKKEEVTIKFLRYVVKTDDGHGNIEDHEFASEEEAKRFIWESRK